jgi:CheY-like chemotaxis protein
MALPGTLSCRRTSSRRSACGSCSRRNATRWSGSPGAPRALQLAAYDRPDLAIIDMMLEIDVDGIRTATALARQFALKILITKGFPDSVSDAKGVPDLACAIAKKPHGETDILVAVARCLGG